MFNTTIETRDGVWRFGGIGMQVVRVYLDGALLLTNAQRCGHVSSDVDCFRETDTGWRHVNRHLNAGRYNLTCKDSPPLSPPSLPLSLSLSRSGSCVATTVCDVTFYPPRPTATRFRVPLWSCSMADMIESHSGGTPATGQGWICSSWRRPDTGEFASCMGVPGFG